jgi:hypothetical protein
MHMLAHEAGDCEGIQKSPLVGETDGHFSATRYYSYAPYTYTYSYRQKCRRRTFLTVSSQCLGRFRSFFRFYKSQYYVRNIIFYNFFCFDIPKIIYEQFSVRGWEEMCSKWYLPRNSTDFKNAAPVCISIC